MNYLILTPDGMGSTMLQRMLTIYLNVFQSYYNTHELTNGIENIEGKLLRKFSVGAYDESIDQIISYIDKSENNVISRLANYHLKNRIATVDSAADHKNFYKFLNNHYQNIIACYRDPFEYALSWSIRNRTNKLNVYSLKEKNEIFLDQKFDIDIDFFNTKLRDFIDYDYWVNDNFNNISEIDYDSITGNIQNTLEVITGCDQKKVTSFLRITLDRFNTMYYAASEKKRLNKSVYATKNDTKGFIKILKFIGELEKQRKLPGKLPIKMNTLETKFNIITNFDNALKNYNKWATKSNKFEELDLETLKKRMMKENQKYSHVFNTWL